MRRYRNRNSGEFGAELGLGDLPEDIQAERERVADMTALRRGQTSSRRDAVGDLKYQDSVKKKPKVAGTVPYSGEVISTFDSRPINSIDFSNTTLETFTLTANPGDATTVTSTYAAPGGYVAVLRGYRYEMQPAVPIDYDDLLVDILVNNVSQLGYRSLMHGQAVSDFIPCFILADSGHNITLNLRAPNGINSVIPDVRKIIVEIYGNLLQTTGAPLQLEIANKEIGLPVKSTQTTTSRALRSFLRSRSFSRRFRFF